MQWKIPLEEIQFADVIGKGNFGEVWKGSYLGTDVAIKKLFFVDDQFMQKYIEREMDTLTQLNHPNIVQLMGMCIGLDDLYIVTEFVKGGSLNSKLENPSVSLNWKLRIRLLLEVSLAMAYLHAKGKMHRDLKSHNLLVTEDWKVKVCDFGLARSSPDQDEKRSGITMVGTNEWMAPEVAMGESYDGKADVFSFAMVMYEVITRTDPPDRKMRDAYAFKADAAKDKIPDDTPPALWDLLVQCAAHNPAERPEFKTVVAALKDLFANTEGTPEAKVTSAPASTESDEKDKAKKKKKPKKKAESGGTGEEKGKKKKKKKSSNKEGQKKKK